jgi:hypothetical protein
VLVIPVVQDELQEIEIAASRDRLEEIPGADLDTSTVGFG